MKSKVLAMTLGFLVLLASPLYGQQFEIHPYVAGAFPAGFGGDEGGDFKNVAQYGVRGGLFLTDRVSVEGNLGYTNHFEFENTDPKSRALMWDVNGLYHFFPETTGRAAPFLTFGIGGTTALLDRADDPTQFLLQFNTGSSTKRQRRVRADESSGSTTAIHSLVTTLEPGSRPTASGALSACGSTPEYGPFRTFSTTAPGGEKQWAA